MTLTLRPVMVDDPWSQPLDKSTLKAIRNRDGFKCCLDGMTTQKQDDPTVHPFLPLREAGFRDVSYMSVVLVNTDGMQESLRQILEAFVGRPLNHYLLSLSERSHAHIYGNHWLLSRAAGRAFAKGWITLRRNSGSEVGFPYHVIDSILSIYSGM